MGDGGDELAHRREARHVGKLRLSAACTLHRHRTLGDVHGRPENLHRFARGVDDGMRHDVMKADRAIRQNDSMLEIDVTFLAHDRIGLLQERHAIVRMNALANDFLERNRRSRLVRKNTEHLVRPEDLARNFVLRPTPGMREPLTFREITFAASRAGQPERNLIGGHSQKKALDPRRKISA